MQFWQRFQSTRLKPLLAHGFTPRLMNISTMAVPAARPAFIEYLTAKRNNGIDQTVASEDLHAARSRIRFEANRSRCAKLSAQ
jgi:hypothetical protein